MKIITLLLAITPVLTIAAQAQDSSQVVIITPDSPPVSVPDATVAKPPIPKAPPKAPPQKTTADYAASMVRAVLKETSQVRGLKVLRQVPAGIQSAAGVEKMVREQIAKSANADEVVGTELLLKKLGLAPANFDLKSYYVSMLGEQLAGYYDTKTKKFYTTEHVNRLQLETIMAHELTHALQDQHFDLTRLEKWPKHDSDAKMAISALVEGDATFTMARYAVNNPLRALGLLASSLSPANSSPILTSGPNALKEGLTFPYVQGMNFARALYSHGGWAAVSGAFKRFPQSSEQILHPEKYLAREAPLKLRTPDLSPSLGKGWRRLDYDVNGEFGLALILKEFVASPTQVANAAAGWAGDQYAVYRGPQGQSLFAQVCAWDSAADAKEFFDAYIARTNTRYSINPASNNTSRAVWKIGEGDVWMERRGKRVVILEGLPSGANAANLAARLWR